MFSEFFYQEFGDVADGGKSFGAPEPFFMKEEAAPTAFPVDIALGTWFADSSGGNCVNVTKHIPVELWGDGTGENLTIRGDCNCF